MTIALNLLRGKIKTERNLSVNIGGSLMNEQFEKWWQVFDATPRQSILGLKTAAWEGWKARRESMKPIENRFGCTADDNEECYLDTDSVKWCIHAQRITNEGKSKTDCPYWKEVDK